MTNTTSHIVAAIFALLLTASLFQQAIAMPPASATAITTYELA